MSNTRLYRSESDRVLGGVCGGIAEVYDADPTLVRLLTVLIVLATGIGPFLYLIAWLIMPTESEVKGRSTGKVEEVEIDKTGSADEDAEDESGEESSDDSEDKDEEQ